MPCRHCITDLHGNAAITLQLSIVGYAAMACLPSHSCELLQDLAASAAALVGIAQLLVPAVSFFKDMWPYTAGFQRNPIVIGTYITCTLLFVAWALVPTLFSASGAVWAYFPFRYRGFFAVFIVATNIVAVSLSNIRRCLQPRFWSHNSNAVSPLND